MKPLLVALFTFLSIAAFAENEVTNDSLELDANVSRYGYCVVDLVTRNGGFLDRFQGRDCREAMRDCRNELDYRQRTGRNPYARCVVASAPPVQESWTCVANDRGHEEHWGGHEGYGRSQSEAANNAMNICLMAHGRCYVSDCRRSR
jgi:hypothetical protein